MHHSPFQCFCQAILLCIALIRLANCYGGIINPIGHQADPQPISRIENDGKRWYYFPSVNGREAQVNMFASTNLNDVYFSNSPSNKHSIFNFTKNVHQNPEAPALVGTDGATHIIDEMPRPHLDAPAAMIIAPIIGSLSAFILLIVFLFVLKDFDSVASSSAGPLLEIIYQAVGNKGGAVALYMFPVCSMGFAAISILCASSRQTQAFARDYGLPFAHFFSKESRTFGVPIPAITLTSFWVIVFGCIYLGSTSAYNAIISSSVVMLQWTYCIPVILLMVRGRSLLDTIAAEEEENAIREQNDIIQGTIVEPETQTILHVKRHYNMGRWGYLVNAYGVAFNIVTSVFFLFPPELPATGSTANYAAAVVAFVFLLAVLSWIFDGRKKYSGPRDLAHALARARDARGEYI